MSTQRDIDPASPGHARLGAFVGKWNLEGRQYESPFGQAAKITAAQTYEWLPGGFFLVLRFDGLIGSAPAACIEITGHDALRESYPTHTFYNDGNTMQWQLRERGGTWIRTGTLQRGGTSMKIRCTTVFSDAGRTMTSKWEHSKDGSHWLIFWDLSAGKAEMP